MGPHCLDYIQSIGEIEAFNCIGTALWVPLLCGEGGAVPTLWRGNDCDYVTAPVRCVDVSGGLPRQVEGGGNRLGIQCLHIRNFPQQWCADALFDGFDIVLLYLHLRVHMIGDPALKGAACGTN